MRVLLKAKGRQVDAREESRLIVTACTVSILVPVVPGGQDDAERRGATPTDIYRAPLPVDRILVFSGQVLCPCGLVPIPRAKSHHYKKY